MLVAAPLLGGRPAVGAELQQLVSVVLVVHGAVRLGFTVLLRGREREEAEELFLVLILVRVARRYDRLADFATRRPL